MLSTAYRIYIDNIFTIAKTMVIKHHEAAMAMNSFLAAKGYVINYNAPATWKYYLNIAGEYHESDLDDIRYINNGSSPYMLIKTASNLGPVDTVFNKALIDPVLGDVSIANEYQYNSSYYKELLVKYPEQESLILGILNPIPVSVSVDSDDGDILYCGGWFKTSITDSLGFRYTYSKRTDYGLDDLNLIEEQEIDLITALEDWVKGFLARWHIRDYGLIDDLYLPSMYSVLFSNIPKQIMNIRKSYCKSNMAHSFHIREYLESNGKLGKYVNILPLRQKLFLYRNVQWISANVGRNEVFDLLVDNLATPNEVPLAGYRFKHNLSDQPASLYSDPLLEREIINFVQTGSDKTTVTIENMTKRLKLAARDNGRDLVRDARVTRAKTILALDNDIPTKIVESDMVDSANLLPFKLADTLFSLWIYTAVNGTYTANIYAINTKTTDRLILTPITALILTIYCLNKGYTGTAPVNVPTLVARNIPLYPYPDISVLQDKVEASRVSDSALQNLIGMQIPDFDNNSVDKFYRAGVDIHAEQMRRYRVTANAEYLHANVQLVHAMSSLYALETPLALTTTPYTYDEWLSENGYNFDSFSREELVVFGNNILTEALGLNIKTEVSRADIQQAVIEIMKQFTSYSLAYIYNINDGDTTLLNIRNLRTDNLRISMKAKGQIAFSPVSVSGIKFTPNPVLASVICVPTIS